MITKSIIRFFILFFIQSISIHYVQAQNENNFSINGLPVIHLSLQESGTITKEDKLKATMRIENANGSNYTNENLYNGLIEISGRGNSTWGMPKKPYNIDLIDARNEDNPAPLLGMPSDEEWALIANYSDKSLLRICTAYYLGNAIGMEYSPRLRFVEVYLDDEYLGLYCLCEKIKKADSRVDVKKLTQDAGDQAEPKVSGGYILEVTPASRLETDDKYFTSGLGIDYVFKYPKKKNVTNEQIDWIHQYINKTEAALYGVNFKDPDTGYRQYIDVDSFVDWYIINDFAKNPDATFFASVFLYKDRNGKLKMGPLWDFDIAFGNIDYNSAVNEENGFWIKNGAWFNRLTQDPYFQQKVAGRYDQIKPILDSMPQKIKDAAAYLKNTGSIDRNFEKWPILGTYVWPNFPPYPATYDGEIQRLTDWFKERIDWLNIHLPISETEQCQRLQNTKPHISITDFDEFNAGDSCRIKTTDGYTHYYWNGADKTTNTILASPEGKYWVSIEDNKGCKSLASDTLYFEFPAKILFDSSVDFTYDGTPKSIHASTVPEGLPLIYNYNGDTTRPVAPGDYEVQAVINNSPYFKGFSDTILHLHKAKQQINFPPLPQIIYIPGNASLNAAASSGLPVQYILLSGNAEIRNNQLYPKKVGQLIIKAIQPGNEFYESADTASQNTWAEYENDFTKNLQAFPSPFQNSVTITYPYNEKTNLLIYNSRGKKIGEFILSGTTKTLNLGSLSKGIYTLYFSSSKGKGL